MKSLFKNIGPGFVIAATGLGAGDLIAATVAGIRFETALLWAVLLGAVLKAALNEGLGRWQLQTGQTLLEGWVQRLPRWVQYYFGVYLFLWSLLVGAALMAACGLAANALFPALSINQWAIIHSALAVCMVLYGRYSVFENLMKLFIGLMFVTVLMAVWKLPLDWPTIAIGFIPTVPADSLKLILGVIGGVGGSVTLLCYGYWIQEKGWNKPEHVNSMRIDLWSAYGITAVFGVCIIILAANVQPENVSGASILVALADKLEETLGSFFGTLFLIGFWGAVFSSMLGVWQGVPYLFADFYHQQTATGKPAESVETLASSKLKNSKAYYAWLGFLAGPPFLLLFFEKPIWLALTYAVVGAFFMPFLAATLLYMNNKVLWVKGNKNRLLSNALLATGFALFLYLFVQKIIQSF